MLAGDGGGEGGGGEWGWRVGGVGGCASSTIGMTDELTFLLSLSSAKGFAIILIFSLLGAASSPFSSFFGVLTFFSFFSPILIVCRYICIYVFEV